MEVNEPFRLTWADQGPSEIRFVDEEAALGQIVALARRVGYTVLELGRQTYAESADSDLVVDTPHGRLLFAVRRKSSNARARIDVETRPKDSYRTRHVLLEKESGGEWIVKNDSDLSEGPLPDAPEAFRALVVRLFSPR